MREEEGGGCICLKIYVMLVFIEMTVILGIPKVLFLACNST